MSCICPSITNFVNFDVQVENLQEEVEVSYDVRSLTEDNTKLRLEVERLKEESSLALEEAKSLSGQLKMQQTMYSELKKMRGMSDQMEHVEEIQRVSYIKNSFCSVRNLCKNGNRSF